MKFIDVFRSF